MRVDGSGLRGGDAEVSVTTLVNGGMWVRPVRGDMLRLPHQHPQVQTAVTHTHTHTHALDFISPTCTRLSYQTQRHG